MPVRRGETGALPVISPKRWQTEKGPAPWLAAFGLEELDDLGYASRTTASVLASDGGLLFLGESKSPGTELARRILRVQHQAGVRRELVSLRTQPSQLVAWIREKDVKVVNVGGLLAEGASLSRQRPGCPCARSTTTQGWQTVPSRQTDPLAK